MTKHLWSGRFAEAPDADVFGFQSSFAFDRRLFEDDVTGSLAWVEALAAAGERPVSMFSACIDVSSAASSGSMPLETVAKSD